MRSSNPVLRAKGFEESFGTDSTSLMTIDGVVNRSFILLFIIAFFASLSWKNPEGFLPFIWIFVIGGLITALITIFKPQYSNITSLIYASFEGLFLGAISVIMERSYPGIVMQAILLTFTTLFSLLLLYRTKVIKVTNNFRLGVVAATGGICLLYLLSFILGFFGVSMSFIYSGGLIGIGFSILVVIIASLNLVLDFDFIENAQSKGAPKYMEWYAAFALMVTLIWLYIEILRLLSKTRQR